MARVTSKLITKKMPWHANMTDMNHLGAALIAKPAVFMPKFDQLFTSQKYSNNPMTTILNKMASTKEVENEEFEWDMRGATSRPLVVMENMLPASNTTPGKFKTTFPIKLDEDWYVPGDVIAPANGSKKFQVRIQEQAFGHGNTGTVYIVRLMSDDPQAYLPIQYLATGTPWTKLFSQYEEAAEQSGSTQYSGGLSLKSRIGRYRKHYRVTGDVANEVLAVKIPDGKGNYYDSWIKYAEVEYWRQWYEELERGYWYSRSTTTVKGANGRPIYSGPGIQELLEDSHVHRYSVLTARLIEEYLMDIFYARVKPGGGRKIKAFTGEYGMIMFHRAIQSLMEKSSFIQLVQNTFVEKASSDVHSNALSYGYQFTKYKMANGAELELIHLPLYDDRELNAEIDPITGYPVESMRYTFLDFSDDTSANNITLLNRKNSMKLGYVAGLHTPYGPVTGNKLMSHSGDYYEMHCQKQTGVNMTDVGRCGELILSRN